MLISRQVFTDNWWDTGPSIILGFSSIGGNPLKFKNVLVAETCNSSSSYRILIPYHGGREALSGLEAGCPGKRIALKYIEPLMVAL